MGQDLFADHNPYSDRLVRNDAYLPLIKAAVDRNPMTPREIAASIGMSRSFLNRLLNGKRAMSEEHLQSLFIVLKINPSRAYLAVVQQRDWTTYEDATIVLVDDLIQELLPALRQKRSLSEMVELSQAAVRHLSSQLTDAIVKNDHEVAERRAKVMISAARAG